MACAALHQLADEGAGLRGDDGIDVVGVVFGGVVLEVTPVRARTLSDYDVLRSGVFLIPFIGRHLHSTLSHSMICPLQTHHPPLLRTNLRHLHRQIIGFRARITESHHRQFLGELPEQLLRSLL